MEGQVSSASLDDVTFTIVDVETTGLNPHFGDRVCEIALLRCRAGQELDRFVTLVNPGRPISPGAFAVNGIRDEEVVDAPVFADVASTVLEMLGETVLVAHNAPFDLAFLASELQMCGLTLPDNEVIDTLALARRCYSFYSNSLQNVARFLGIEVCGQHRALADVITTKQVLQRFLVDLAERGVCTLAGLAEAQGGHVPVPGLEAVTLPIEIKEAFSRQGRVELRYLSASGQETRRVVSPLAVTEYAGYVYLVAFCHLRKEQRTFRLDRIIEMG